MTAVDTWSPDDVAIIGYLLREDGFRAQGQFLLYSIYWESSRPQNYVQVYTLYLVRSDCHRDG